jgi:isoquinoline 1-oxidoreductase beta subunit
MVADTEGLHLSRRKLLVGGGLGVGLLLAWSLWPRRFEPNLRVAPGESLYNAFLKVATDGRVIVAVPQVELGQGVHTSLPQILADELGADWRTVAVEPAPISPLYGNHLLAEEITGERVPLAVQGAPPWSVRESATRSTRMLTGGSTSIRAFEAQLREAGAAGRALLSKAAARRWDVDWETLDTRGGFVWNGDQKISFGELAEEASQLDLPGDLPVRGGDENRLSGEPLPRIDLPSKVDGSAQFAGDIRLPDMLFASIRAGPTAESTLLGIDRAAAQRIPGVITIVENPRWVAVLAINWWAANRAVEATRPRFETKGPLIGTADVERALAVAMDGAPTRVFTRGDAAIAMAAGNPLSATYTAGFAPNAAIEPLTATARLTGDQLEIWAPTQAPGYARAAAARAAGLSEANVTLYPTLIGGGYGRKIETAAIEQVAIIAQGSNRPVQLTWSRIEETWHDSLRPPARATLVARLDPAGTIAAWQARIAAPSTRSEVAARLRSGEILGAGDSEAAAVDGAMPPYSIPAVSVDHLPASIGVPTGIWRSAAHSYTAFFNESFIDELARQAKVEPLSFRMQMLGDNPRLARVITTAATLGGWDGGGEGSSMGLAAHSAFGSHAALVVDVEIDGKQQIRVKRAVCAVDCGRIINPEIVRQQIEGGIVFGIAGATGRAISLERGLPTARGFGELGLPLLANSPEVTVELIPNEEEPGGVTELAVPPVAPAIANALFALTGRRLRSLPLVVGGQ